MTNTSTQKWANAITKYKKQSQKIMSVSKSIRHVGIINKFGRTLTGSTNHNIKLLLDSVQAKNEFFIISTLLTLRKSNELGAIKYVILKHAKVSVVILQKNEITFYISINSKEKNIDKIILAIKKLI